MVKDAKSYDAHQRVVNAVWKHRKAMDAVLGITREYKKRGVEPAPSVQAQIDVFNQQRLAALADVEQILNELTAQFDEETALEGLTT